MTNMSNPIHIASTNFTHNFGRCGPRYHKILFSQKWKWKTSLSSTHTTPPLLPPIWHNSFNQINIMEGMWLSCQGVQPLGLHLKSVTCSPMLTWPHSTGGVEAGSATLQNPIVKGKTHNKNSQISFFYSQFPHKVTILVRHLQPAALKKFGNFFFPPKITTL